MAHISRLGQLVRGVLAKPPHVVAYRAWQELELRWMSSWGGWPRLEERIRTYWNAQRVDRFLRAVAASPGILAPDAHEALRIMAADGRLDRGAVLARARRICRRDFSVLNAPVPVEGPFPWHTDWRFGHTWLPGYFRHYDLYTARTVPYDVKVPWELSRLGFLTGALQAAFLEADGPWVSFVRETLHDWESRNPLAHSVNWYPMEVSMRGIQLVFLLEMLLLLPKEEQEMYALSLRLITSHGDFLSRTVEYTDVRGNHYAANMVALLLIGLALRGVYPKAVSWVNRAARAINHEIPLQLLADGVDFEKSTPYHRLVTELFLVALIIMDRNGLAVSQMARERAHRAVRYTAAYTRPDGLSPVIGDNDNGLVLEFDPVPLRDHRPLVGIGAVFFGDGQLKSVAGRPPVAMAWLLGRQAVEAWSALATEPVPDGLWWFESGGVAVARHANHYLLVDVGEVGMHGRGGHGHNDVFSFELVLDGVPLIVDPGISVYTGDPEERNLFRSTAYHNTVRIDKTEIAPFRGMWRIGNEACPYEVSVEHEGSLVRIAGTHGGYQRLSDPVEHRRTFRFDGEAVRVDVCDLLMAREKHLVERFLHFAPEVEAELAEAGCLLSSGGYQWRLWWDDQTTACLGEGWISPGYGKRVAARTLTLITQISGRTELYVGIERSTGS